MTERKLRKLLVNAVPIETERLVIRKINLDDAHDMYEYSSLDDVCEFLLWSPHINITVTEGYIEFLQKRYLRGLFADWAIVLKQNGKMIGTCGYAAVDKTNSICEIGYVLSPKYQKQGYMTEAVKALLELTFSVLNLEIASLRIINENEPSKRLAERLGFKLDSIKYNELEIKGIYRDIAHYRLSREEYMTKKEAVE